MRRLETVLGQGAASGKPQRGELSEKYAERILDSLKYGHNLGFVCGFPSIASNHWGRIRLLEQAAEDEKAYPFERLASALAGVNTVMEIAIERGDAGLSLLLGFPTDAELGRARLLLAPGSPIEPTAPPTLGSSYVVGVTHRPQSVTGEASGAKVAECLIDRLEGIKPPWTLFMHCESASMTDVLGTMHKLDSLAEEAASRVNVTHQVSDTTTNTAISHRWNRVQDWTKVIAELLTQGADIGLWTVDTWATANDADTVRLLAGSLHGAIPSDQGRWYETLDYDQPEPRQPPPTSALTSRDIGGLLCPPRFGKPGLGVRPAPPSGRRPTTSPNSVMLGAFQGTDSEATIGVEDLEGHAFVTGTTGSGKSTTLHRLLAELWNRHGIPFLVLDPVKDDYSSAAAYFEGGIQVVRGADIHLNLMESWPGEDGRNHITQVASAFRGAFSMPSPTPYVVTQLFDKVAMLPSGGAGMSLFDVRDMVPDLIKSLGYAPEPESNIRAALMTRLNLLLAPTRAHRFSWTNSSMVSDLFQRPSVVTLADLTDDEERSFVVILLALATWAHAKNKTNTPPVDHVLVLEEAHRILPEIDERNVNPEVGSAKQVSASMLSAMMAEVRSYGEQIIVVDQSPSRVSSDVSRNTNLKIAHRVVHPEDQVQVAGMLGLPEESSALLGQLERGKAIYTTRTEPTPQTIAVTPLFDSPKLPNATTQSVKPPPVAWPCGTSNIEAHYRAWQLGSRASEPMSLFLAGILWGDGNGRKLREHIYLELLKVADGDQALTDCLAWSGLRQLTARRRSAGPASGKYCAESQLDSLYQVWAGRIPVTHNSAEGVVVIPPAHGALAADSHLTWEEQSIADALLKAEPRNGVRALYSANWRTAIPDLVDYLKARKAKLTPLLGTGADAVLNLLVAAAVSAAGLTPDVSDSLISRAKIAPRTAT